MKKNRVQHSNLIHNTESLKVANRFAGSLSHQIYSDLDYPGLRKPRLRDDCAIN